MGAFTTFSATAFPPGGMRGVREAGDCLPACFLSVCDRHLPPARGDFPNALAPVSNPAGTQVGRLVPSDRAGRPAGARDVTPSRGQAPQTSGHKGLSSRLSSRKSRRSLSQVLGVGISGARSARPLPGERVARMRRERGKSRCLEVIPKISPIPLIRRFAAPSPRGEGGVLILFQHPLSPTGERDKG